MWIYCWICVELKVAEVMRGVDLYKDSCIY
jgi:hypothetical protein